MTFEEMVIKDLIRKNYNDYVGWRTNAYSDWSDVFENENPSLQDCKDYIYFEIMNTKEKYLEAENGFAIETKHIRFLGAKKLQDMISEKVEKDYEKNGWKFPHVKPNQGGK